MSISDVIQLVSIIGSLLVASLVAMAFLVLVAPQIHRFLVASPSPAHPRIPRLTPELAEKGSHGV